MYWTGGAAKESREIIIFGHESRGTLKEEWLCWRSQQQFTRPDSIRAESQSVVRR
jgi:hypothetical protein